MIQKIALAVGGLGAAAVLAFALGLTNFVFAIPGVTKPVADSQPAAQAADVGVAGPGNPQDVSAGSGAGAGTNQGTQTKKVIDKVYVAPPPAPKVIHVTPAAPNNQPAPAAPPAAAAQPKTPSAAPATHNNNQESDRGGAQHGHERGGD